MGNRNSKIKEFQDKVDTDTDTDTDTINTIVNTIPTVPTPKELFEELAKRKMIEEENNIKKANIVYKEFYKGIIRNLASYKTYSMFDKVNWKLDKEILRLLDEKLSIDGWIINEYEVSDTYTYIRLSEKTETSEPAQIKYTGRYAD